MSLGVCRFPAKFVGVAVVVAVVVLVFCVYAPSFCSVLVWYVIMMWPTVKQKTCHLKRTRESVLLLNGC